MEKYDKSLTDSLLTWGFGIILGVLFGLIVLGWWLWPVQWVDGSPENMRYQYQVEYLTSVIEAYGFNSDASIAQARYFALGANAETALAQIVQNPSNLPPELVTQFSEQVAGVPADTLATQPIEEPKTTTGLNPWVAVLFTLLFIAIGAVVTYLIFRGRERQESEVEYIEYESTPPDEMEPEGQIGLEEAGTFTFIEEQVVEESPAQTDVETDVVEEWIPVMSEEDEITTETTEEAEPGSLDLPPFIAAAAGAAVVAGAIADEDSEAVAASKEIPEKFVSEGEEPAVEITEEQLDETPEEVSTEGAAMAGLAAAWLAEEQAEAEEQVEGEQLEEETLLAEQEEVFAGEEDEEETEEEIEAPEFTDLDEDAVSEDEEFGEEEGEIDTELDLPGEEAVNPNDPIEVKMRKKLDFVEGIGEVYSQKLSEVGIHTTGKLMVEGVTRTGRQELAEKTGISEHLILKWLNEIDLYRIKGIGSEYADLLETAGVDTVPELAQRNPEHLHQALASTNEEKRLVRQIPSQDQVKDWVEQAKKLPRIIQY